ncbi:Rne/Rng family ribonuclease [Nonomuraea antri]|uniref:Rne/Rng family ribonuclease n=1 Tax=Nonomuraea antri TaxID=2730852 RepID=UPI001F3839F9|nr:Rne/Rng family ribonuclease [Nonomuraea antri]
MLENEPNGGAIGPDGETTEQPKVIKRRRSSRPAGPPPELPEEPASAPVTVPAAQAAPTVAPGKPLPSTAAQRAAGEPAPIEEYTSLAEAQSPAEPQSAAEPQSTVEAAVADAVAEAVAEAAVAESVAETMADAVADAVAEAVAETGAPVATPEPITGPITGPIAGQVAEEAPAEKPKRATRTRSTATTPRRRTTKKAAEAEAGAEVAGALPAQAPAEAPVAEPAEAPQVSEVAAPGEVEAAPVKRRRTRKKAEPEPEAIAPEPVVADAVIAEAIEPESAEVLAEAAPAARQEAEPEARADEDILEILPEDEPLDDEPAGEDLDEEVERPSLLSDPFGLSARRQDQPGMTFQRPAAIFAPLFQAPDPTQAKPARLPEPVQPPAAEVREVRETREPREADEEPVEEIAEDEGDLADLDTDEQEEEGTGRRRRRRRGGRGRGKSRERDESEEGDESEDEGDEEQAEEAQEEETSSSRRRRRRRRRGTEDGAEPSSDDPPNTVVRIRAPRAGRAALDTATDGVQSVRGSTRLEAKKQRRREGRELGRRRPPIITESEFLARRESVDRMMVVRRQGDRTQMAVLEDGVLVEHYVNREASQSYVGNVYLGKVQNVLPSMEAAFVDIGKGRNAVLYAGEVNFDTAGLEGQPKRIESALKSGQSVLVQVTKDPIGHKGARLTSQISLPGRYLVYVPDGSMTGISRKLPDKERTRLKSILKKVMPENAGVIVRTAAEGASEDELARDVARLSAQWENIQKKAKSASPPELLSAEPDLTIRVVRDVFNEDFTSLVVQGDDAWETVDEYVKYVAPHLGERLSKWDTDENGDVFESYRIDEQLAKALERKVWLPSGGSLVIDRTEAMTVVDVNTGKFTGQGGNLEETVTRNNLEAAEEIVRQLRLRDIGGIIVIDFIDMVLESNRDLVLRRLLECLARDRTKHQVAEVTSLGLVQMTRKRVGQGLLEAFSTPCECCNGRGLIVSTEPVEAKPEPRGTQGKMAIEKAVSDKVSAAKDSASRDTVTGALEDVPGEDDQASQTSGRGRRRSRRAKSTD